MAAALKKSYFHILKLFLANLSKAGMGFIGSVVILKGWSDRDIADIYTMVGVLLLISQFGDLGMGSGFIKLLSERKTTRRELTETFWTMKVLICVAVFGLSLFFTACYFFISPTREVMSLAAVAIAGIFLILSGYFAVLLTALQKFNGVAWMKVVPPTVKTLFIISMFFLGVRSYPLLLLAFLMPPIVGVVIGYLLRPDLGYKVRFMPKVTESAKDLFHISKWVYLIGVFQTTFSQIDIFMLKRMSSDFYVTQFVSASKLAGILLMVSQAFFTVMLPRMNEIRSDATLIDFSKKLFLFYIGFLLLLYPASLVSPYAIHYILGERYIGALPVLNVFFFQVIGGMFITSQSLMFYRKNKLPYFVVITGIQLTLNFVGNYMVIHQYKALGAVWVSAILNNAFYLFILLVSLWILRRNPEKQNQ